MNPKTEEDLKREREALRDRTRKTLEGLAPGFEIELFRNQMIVYAIPGTSRRSVDVRFGNLDLERPCEFEIRINLPATGSFDPTNRDDATVRMCLAASRIVDNAPAIKEALRRYDAESRELTEAYRQTTEG